jgi:hypothetical protein
VRSLPDLAQDPELAKPVDWELYPYTARGRLTLLASPPKRGKTTFAAHYAVAKASGGQFVGQQLRAGPVLWVAPDEHVADQVRRFVELQAQELELIHIWVTPSPRVEAIAAYAEKLKAELVVIDTLPRVADIWDENDNAAWTNWSNGALPLIRETDAAWLVLHHHRKSGGKDGQAIRGASAVFACVDVALSLDSGGTDRQRCLVMDGTRYERIEDLIVELHEGQYAVIGDAPTARALKDPDVERILSVLCPEPATVDRIAERLAKQNDPFTETTLRRKLDRLVSLGHAQRHGEGGQRDPYRYSSTNPNPGNPEDRRSTEQLTGRFHGCNEPGRTAPACCTSEERVSDGMTTSVADVADARAGRRGHVQRIPAWIRNWEPGRSHEDGDL